MRDPNRLYKFYEQLRNVHMEHFPDLRFGQLCYNFFAWLAERNVDYFFPEEDEMLRALDRYIEDHNKRRLGKKKI